MRTTPMLKSFGACLLAGRTAQDAELLADVLTDWGLCSSGDLEAGDRKTDLEEAIRQQVCASMGATDDALLHLEQPWVSGWDEQLVLVARSLNRADMTDDM